MFKIANQHRDFSAPRVIVMGDRAALELPAQQTLRANPDRPMPDAGAQFLQDEAHAFLIHELEQ